MINQLKQITENIHDIKEYDSINMNNINIMINKIVDMMINNENKEHKQRIEEINKLKNKQQQMKLLMLKKDQKVRKYQRN